MLRGNLSPYSLYFLSESQEKIAIKLKNRRKNWKQKSKGFNRTKTWGECGRWRKIRERIFGLKILVDVKKKKNTTYESKFAKTWSKDLKEQSKSIPIYQNKTPTRTIKHKIKVISTKTKRQLPQINIANSPSMELDTDLNEKTAKRIDSWVSAQWPWRVTTTQNDSSCLLHRIGQHKNRESSWLPAMNSSHSLLTSSN